jgi:hypothetical protein
MARELIAAVLKKMDGEGDLLFTTTGTTPISGWSPIKRRLDAAMKIPPWRLHDLRRTFVTGMAELGVRGDVIELAVNHVSGLRAIGRGEGHLHEIRDQAGIIARLVDHSARIDGPAEASATVAKAIRAGNLRLRENAWWRTQPQSNLSPLSNSLLTGKLTGNFADSGALRRFWRPVDEQIQ